MIEDLLHRVAEDYNFTQSLTIGIQIRSGDSEMIQLEEAQEKAAPKQRRSHREVDQSAAECFAWRALDIWANVEDKTHYPEGLVVFVTADSVHMASRVVEVVTDAGFRAFSGEKYGGDVRHIDKSSRDQKRTFLDWFLLSRMDRLVISQSGFSESAGKLSCSPASIFHNAPNTPAINDLPSCKAHFFEMQETGLCHPFVDHQPANIYISKVLG